MKRPRFRCPRTSRRATGPCESARSEPCSSPTSSSGTRSPACSTACTTSASRSPGTRGSRTFATIRIRRRTASTTRRTIAFAFTRRSRRRSGPRSSVCWSAAGRTSASTGYDRGTCRLTRRAGLRSSLTKPSMSSSGEPATSSITSSPISGVTSTAWPAPVSSTWTIARARRPGAFATRCPIRSFRSSS